MSNDLRRLYEEAGKPLERQPPAYVPGELVKGEGIFLRKMELTDSNGLRRAFNVFAAPQDLPDMFKREARFTYMDAINRIALLKDWHGHDGLGLASDATLVSAIGAGFYKGHWIMPTMEILCGQTSNEERVEGGSLFQHRLKGAFRRTFTQESGSSVWDEPSMYWSCTVNPAKQEHVATHDFSKDKMTWRLTKGLKRYSCRPVRLVEV